MIRQSVLSSLSWAFTANGTTSAASNATAGKRLNNDIEAPVESTKVRNHEIIVISYFSYCRDFLLLLALLPFFHRPHVNRVFARGAADLDGLVRLPRDNARLVVVPAIVVRDDARARLEVLQRDRLPQVHELREHVHDHDGGVTDVLDLEGVAVAHFHQGADGVVLVELHVLVH